MFPRSQNASNRRNGQRRFAVMIAREMVTAMRPFLAQQNVSSQSTVEALAPQNHLKNFMLCDPPRFSGNEGATALLQWIESVESVFSVSECPSHLHVKYAASLFRHRALTWWNLEKKNRGMENSHSLPWDDFKSLLLAEFCPRNEIKKLEAEFWDLKQISGNNAEYTTRFHELSLLVPHLVTPVAIAIEKYVDGLPSRIRDIVLGSKPTNLGDAIRLAASLTDNQVKDGKLSCTNSQNQKETETVKPNSKKRKPEPSQNFATHTFPTQTAFHTSQPFYNHPQPTFVQPTPSKRRYMGNYPFCATCGFHHSVGYACRWCTTCNRYGHVATTCRVGTPPVYAPVPLNTVYPICYTCGGQTHFARDCPNNCLAIVPIPQSAAQGQAFNIHANQAQRISEEANNL